MSVEPGHTAGELPRDTMLKGLVTIRKGSIEQRSRGGETRTIAFTVNEGFDVLQAKIERIFTEASLRLVRRNDERVFFRRTKGASQHQFDGLSAENFEYLLTQRWNRISGGDRSRWAGDVVGNFDFEFFVYCHQATPRAPPAMHRATAARLRLASETILNYESENSVQLGPITRNHVATAVARQPDTTQFTNPTDNTTRQAVALNGDARATRRANEDVAARAGCHHSAQSQRVVGGVRRRCPLTAQGSRPSRSRYFYSRYLSRLCASTCPARSGGCG